MGHVSDSSLQWGLPCSRLELAHPKASHQTLPLPTCSVRLAASSTRSFPVKQRWNFAEYQLSTNLFLLNMPWLLVISSSSNVISYGTGDIASLSLAWEIPIAPSAVMSFLLRNTHFMLARTVINLQQSSCVQHVWGKIYAKTITWKKENTMQDHCFHHPE